jgi:hypothetical protein
MKSKIHLLNGQQLLTDRGYMSLEELWEQFVQETPPLVAGHDLSLRRFQWTELTSMARRFEEIEAIQVTTDVFEILAAPDHHVWFYDPAEGAQSVSRAVELNDIFGEVGQFMGIHPMPLGDCPGYTVGPGCWYRRQLQDFVFDLETADGLVFSKSRSREAGIWSGVLTDQKNR